MRVFICLQLFATLISIGFTGHIGVDDSNAQLYASDMFKSKPESSLVKPEPDPQFTPEIAPLLPIQK